MEAVVSCANAMPRALLLDWFYKRFAVSWMAVAMKAAITPRMFESVVISGVSRGSPTQVPALTICCVRLGCVCVYTHTYIYIYI